MTTIAYKDGVLAADTAMCLGGVMTGSVVKIARRADGDMCGSAGDAAYNAAFTEWFLRGEEDAPPTAKQEEGTFDRGVIFRRTGKIDVFEPRGKFTVKASYFAIGSGKESALGAMFAGADAEMAVRAAILFDPHTDGEITVLKCGVY
jgi:20S proteasome alpha/beta subunit